MDSSALRHSKENTGLASMPQTASVLYFVFPDRYAVEVEWEGHSAIGLLGASMVWAAKP